MSASITHQLLEDEIQLNREVMNEYERKIAEIHGLLVALEAKTAVVDAQLTSALQTQNSVAMNKYAGELGSCHREMLVLGHAITCNLQAIEACKSRIDRLQMALGRFHQGAGDVLH